MKERQARSPERLRVPLKSQVYTLLTRAASLLPQPVDLCGVVSLKAILAAEDSYRQGKSNF